MDRALQGILGRLIRQGTLTVTTPKGRTFTVGDGTGTPVAIAFASRRTLAWVLADPDLRLGEAYMDGTLTIQQGTLAEFLDLAVRNIATQPAGLSTRVLRRLRTLYRRLFEYNSFLTSRRNARHHYNIDDRIYRLFLDPDRQYSCAYFERDDMELEEAQQAKKRHIAKKLLLRPGLSVLDIGCGWGGLGLELARAHGARVLGVTLSDEQLAIARQRAREAGLAGRVAFELIDYRNLHVDAAAPNTKPSERSAGVDYSVTESAGKTAIPIAQLPHRFDRIVSVGMFEHVGKRYYPAFFRKCYELLDDDGVMLLHTIGRLDGPADTNAWVWRYIFPGGYTPALSELAPVIERSGFILADIEILRLHYAETLRAWRTAFLARRDEVVRLYEEDRRLAQVFGSADRFIRMWEFYLASMEPGFRYYGLAVFQLQLAKKMDTVPMTRDYLHGKEAPDLRGSYIRAAE